VASKSLTEDVVGELENEYVVCEGFLFVSRRLVSLLRLGGSLPLL
jgi:hypothetical protein